MTTTSSWTLLHTAAKNGETETVENLVKNGAETNAVTTLHWTPLHFSAKYGHFDCCRILIEAGASIIAPTKLRFFTPFHIAALEGHTDIVRLFLEYGADLNIRTAEGWTPLHAAVEHAHKKTVRFLLEHGADPNLAKRATLAVFPLHTAAKNGRKDILQLLLDFGTDPCVQNKHGKYPKDFAEENEFFELAKLLELKPELKTLPYQPNANWIKSVIQGGDLQRLENWLNEGGSASYVPKNGISLLGNAIVSGQPEIVRLLLSHGANTNIKLVWSSESILNDLISSGMVSGRDKYIEIVNILLDHGIKPVSDKQDNPNPFKAQTCCSSIQVLPLSLLERLEAAGLSIEPELKKKMAIRWAVKVKDYIQAEQLLLAGADPNDVKWGDVDAPLHVAIQTDDVEMVRLLVKYGAKVNKKLGYGDSSLYEAAGKGNIEIVKLLVEAGAYVNRKTDGGTPLQAALYTGKTEIVDYLLEHGADIESKTKRIFGIPVNASSTPIFNAIYLGDSEIIQKLIDKGADIHVVGNGGNTLLHVAAEKGLTKWAKYFLDHGLNIEAENWHQQRPLHLAAIKKHKEVVQLLLRHGASVKPPPGIVPIIYAILLDRSDLLETALKENPAGINETHRHPLPILAALEQGNHNIVEILMKYGASLTVSQNIYHPEGTWGDSALSYVSRTGKKDLLELFLKQNINVNSKSSPRPVLHCAATPEIAQILLEHGANPYLRSNEHQTALECQSHNKAVAALLRTVMSTETEN
ncbi:MAG: ankyrin repeat domain-containing protein [Planctomycetaceae bacterium]|nr:ankyrin repeat domain-containing protein [Planctomycetaceae bacterium]